MKQIYLSIITLVIINAIGYSQACCFRIRSTGVTGCGDGVPPASCLPNFAIGRFYMANKPCQDPSGTSNCPTTVCCTPGGCVVGWSQEQCQNSGTSLPWDEWNTCSFCNGKREIMHLESLKGNYSNTTNAAEIAWKMENGITNLQFYVERARNLENFKIIGQADQTSANSGTYRFTDPYPYQISYYRLMFSTLTGLTYSQTITVIAVEKGKLVLFPNPATTRLSILANNMQLFKTEISITDLSGKMMFRGLLNNGEHEINIEQLAAGSYIVRVKQNGNIFTAQLIKN